MQVPQREALRNFFVKELGIKPKNLDKAESDLLEQVDAHFEESEDGKIDSISVNTIIFSLCKWPPFVMNTESGNAMMDIIPDSLVNRFLPILFNYLNWKFEGHYKYDKQTKSIESLDRDEDEEPEDDE